MCRTAPGDMACTVLVWFVVGVASLNVHEVSAENTEMLPRALVSAPNINLICKKFMRASIFRKGETHLCQHDECARLSQASSQAGKLPGRQAGKMKWRKDVKTKTNACIRISRMKTKCVYGARGRIQHTHILAHTGSNTDTQFICRI